MLAYGDARFEKIYYKLVNFLDVESTDLSDNILHAIANRHKAATKYNLYVQTALGVKPEHHDLANKFISYFDDSSWDTRAFDSLDTSSDWLNRK